MVETEGADSWCDSFHFREYDCESNNALEDALSFMYGIFYTYDVYSDFEMGYGWDLSSKREVRRIYKDAHDYKPDPKNKYTEFGPYTILGGETFDNLLHNVYNVEPNHDFIKYSKDFYQYGSVIIYYYDGNYYMFRDDGGDGAGPKAFVKSISSVDGEKYNVKIDLQYGSGVNDMIHLTD